MENTTLIIKKYSFYNNLLGWIVFLIALFVYGSTIEPNASYWDCGEYIAAATKLEIAHSPGAAFFQIIGAVLSIFSFVDASKLPMIINLMSALCSALTILFLFWTITHITKKTLQSTCKKPLTKAQTIVVFGSGLIGSLAFTFSDSFWFSAVEGEVYAMASLFIALLFWLILKWENDDTPRADRWLILISFIIGLGVGVHLMILLTIPAMGLIYYFKKFKEKITISHFLIANFVIALIFGIIFKIIFPYTMKFFGMMEIFAVNTLNLPFNSGTFIAVMILLGLIIAGLYFSQKKGKYYLNTAILSVTFMWIGFSCWLIIPIRANANPPINLNDPSDAIGMLGYFNRDQYGDWPTLYGPVYSAYDYIQQGFNGETDEGPIYQKDKKNNRYEMIGRKKEYKFKSRYKKLFPRMYDPSSREHYEEYIGRQLDPRETPSLWNEISFFMDYQVGTMYMRYLLWNFAGRQNDVQYEGQVSKGNWKSGISFIDNALLGDQGKLPRALKNNKANNQYYFLPLIFGLIGLLFHVRKDPEKFYALFSIFFLTGLGIVIYTNNKIFEPRERDYALVGSFYVFAIWIGLSVGAIFELFKKKKNVPLAIGAAVLVAIAPLLMASQNWDDHDRSGRYTAFSEAKNYFDACKENSILIVYGDNDTYPLWSLQEVQGYRRDLKIINHLLLTADWHAQQAKRKTLDADAVPSRLPLADYGRKMNDNFLVFNDPTLPSLTAKEAVNFIREQKTGKYDRYLNNLKAKKLQEMNNVVDGYQQLEEQMQSAINEGGKNAAQAIQQLGEVQSRVKYFTRIRDEFKNLDLKETAILPTYKIILPVNKEKVLKNGVVSAKYADKIVDSIMIKLPISYKVSEDFISGGSLSKNDLMMLDILAANDWDRGIYFGGAGASEAESVFFLQDYLEYDGFVYQLVPVKTLKGAQGDYGMINTDKLLKIYNQYQWGNLKDKKAYFDYTSRSRNLITFRNTANRLAGQLVKEGHKDKAVKVLDTLMKNIPYEAYENFLISFIIDAYFKAGAYQKAYSLTRKYKKDLLNDYNYYMSLDDYQLSTVSFDARRTGAQVSTLLTRLLKENTQWEKIIPKQTGKTPHKIKEIILEITEEIDRYAQRFISLNGFKTYLEIMDRTMDGYSAYFDAQEVYEKLLEKRVKEDSIPDSLVEIMNKNHKAALDLQTASQEVIRRLSGSKNLTQFMMIAYPYEQIIEFKDQNKTAEELAKDTVYQRIKTLLFVQNAMQQVN